MVRRRQRQEQAWAPTPPPYEPRVPLGTRVARFVGLMGAIFAIAAAVLVTQRLSRDSLALLIGLSCGVMAMVPTMALGVFIWRREDARREAHVERQQAYPASPPVIVVSPQALPGYGPSRPTLSQGSDDWSWAPAQSQRRFEIVGGEE